MFERYHARLRGALTSLAIALRDALTRKLAIKYSMHCDTNFSNLFFNAIFFTKNSSDSIISLKISSECVVCRFAMCLTIGGFTNE